MELRPLDPSSDAERQAAARLLTAALPWDGARVVHAEKLYSGNGGRRSAHTLGAFSAGARELIGVLAQAGRWIKLLAVHPEARGHGVGTALLEAARAHAAALSPENGPRPKLRIGDHAGNYLSPGLDVREAGGQEFFRRRGFAEAGQNLNLRAPVHDNPLLSDERVGELTQRVQREGYRVRRASAEDVAPLYAMIAQHFSPVWAHEVERALGPELGGAAAAHTPTLPEGAAVHVAHHEGGALVAFAAHDGNNRGLGWFGPTGVLREHRGHGIGELLLLHCLRDVAVAAARSDVERPDAGVISWVGPVEYYARACAARPDRRFVVYEEL